MKKRAEMIEKMLGKTVHVIVDRPIGTQHNGITYPINYGYIPELLGGDGEAQDAYIMGVTEPLASFDGQVIGVVLRKNDCEDKLVVAPAGMRFHQAQIAEAVHFQEQYFEYSVRSLVRKSCGVIPFRERDEQTEYLILLQTNQCWSFPKGHMDIGESECQTALRELKEETGLDAELVPEVCTISSYMISPVVEKQVVLFLGKTEGIVVRQENEILDYQWLPASALKDYLHPDTYEACKDLLR